VGLSYPFGYVGYELSFLNTFIYLLENYCSSCHTNRDVDEDCMKCPIGQLIFASKDYLLKAHKYSTIKEEAKIIKSIKKEINNIGPKPMFNTCFIFDKKRNNDQLMELRKLERDLDFFKCSFTRDFKLEKNIRIPIRKRVESEILKLRSSKQK